MLLCLCTWLIGHFVDINNKFDKIVKFNLFNGFYVNRVNFLGILIELWRYMHAKTQLS